MFSSYEFIYIFLPIVLIGYYLLGRINNKRMQEYYLIAASLIFYGWFNVNYLGIIIISVIINYMIIKANKKKSLLIMGIVINLAILGYFKYFNFFVENMNVVFKTNMILTKIMLPIGISFLLFRKLYLSKSYG